MKKASKNSEAKQAIAVWVFPLKINNSLDPRNNTSLGFFERFEGRNPPKTNKAVLLSGGLNTILLGWRNQTTPYRGGRGSDAATCAGGGEVRDGWKVRGKEGWCTAAGGAATLEAMVEVRGFFFFAKLKREKRNEMLCVVFLFDTSRKWKDSKCCMLRVSVAEAEK